MLNWQPTCLTQGHVRPLPRGARTPTTCSLRRSQKSRQAILAGVPARLPRVFSRVGFMSTLPENPRALLPFFLTVPSRQLS